MYDSYVGACRASVLCLRCSGQQVAECSQPLDSRRSLAKNGMLQSARSTLRGQPERFALVPSAAIVFEDNEEEEDLPVLPQLEAESPDSDSDA